MTKKVPIHTTCGQPMIKRGKRPGTDVQRWYCAGCRKWDVDRGGENHLGKKLRKVAPRVIVAAAHGMSVHAIAQVCGKEWLTVERRLKRAAAEAKERLKTETPSVGAGWVLVDLPQGSHSTGNAAVGRKRSTYRLIAWETGTNAAQALESKLGCQPIGPGPTNASGSSEQAWLDRSLGDSARNWEEAERRLRIILAHSNGWVLGKNLDV